MPIEERIAPREIRSLLVGISSAFGALLFVAIVLAMYFGGDVPPEQPTPATDSNALAEASDSQYRRPWAPEADSVGREGPETTGSDPAQGTDGSGASSALAAEPVSSGGARTPPPSTTAPTRSVSVNESKPSVGVRVGVFSVQAYADRAADQLRAAGYEPLVVLTQLNGRVVRYVYAGVYQTEAEAQAAVRRIETQGFDTVIERVIGTPPTS